MEMKEDEKFLEIVEIDGELISQTEGTFMELAKLEKKEVPVVKTTPLKSKVDEFIKVAKFAWDIIKDSKAEAVTESACSRILCAKDDSWQNYGEAEDFISDELTLKLNNFAGVNRYTVTFKIAGTCHEINPDFGGLWIPNVHVTFFKCSATIPWSINGSASIDGTNISNIGTVENPIPQVVLNIKIVTNAKIVFNWESHEKNFEFILNGKDGVKQVR